VWVAVIDPEETGPAVSIVVIVIVTVPPDTLLTASVGVNVPVIVDEPTPDTVAVAFPDPDNEITPVFDDEYDQLPATPFVTVGAVNVNAESPKVFVTLLHENVGVRCAIVIV